MVAQHYRWDFIGLSTDNKPTPETSPKVVDGSTFYCSDTSKLYVFCKDKWYEKTVSGGGGGTSNFNDLSNRPKYNGSEMTSTTDIPEVKTYTAGSNVSITEENVISATDTTYSDFTGTDGTTAGTAGLVPAPATTDAGKFLKADGTWDTAGSAINVVQATGTSATDVMSQNATTSMVFADPSTKKQVCIGGSTSVSGTNGVAIGFQAGDGGYSYGVAIGSSASTSSGNNSVAIGRSANAGQPYSIALGTYAEVSARGEMNIGTGIQPQGYNNSAYRLLTGLYDPQNAHDAATKGYVDGLATMGTLSTTPTGTTVGTPGRLYTYDSGGGTYEVYLCVHDNGDDTYVWKQVSLT